MLYLTRLNKHKLGKHLSKLELSLFFCGFSEFPLCCICIPFLLSVTWFYFNHLVLVLSFSGKMLLFVPWTVYWITTVGILVSFCLCLFLFIACLELSSSITLIKALTNKMTPPPPPPAALHLGPHCCKLLEFLFLAAQILASFFSVLHRSASTKGCWEISLPNSQSECHTAQPLTLDTLQLKLLHIVKRGSCALLASAHTDLLYAGRRVVCVCVCEAKQIILLSDSFLKPLLPRLEFKLCSSTAWCPLNEL